MARSTRDSERQLFKDQFLPGQLSDGDVDELLAHAHVAHYAAGSEIFAKGSPGDSMMAVLRGEVRISSPSPEGHEIVFNIIEAGEIFGEIALIDGQDRSAGATALTDCELLVVHRRDFKPFLERRAHICLLLLEIACQRLRQTSEQVEDVLFGDVGSRMAKSLIRLARRSPPRGQRQPETVLHITQQQLGSMVGGTRESVNRQLQVWQKAGLIKLGKGSIEICDADALQRMI